MECRWVQFDDIFLCTRLQHRKYNTTRKYFWHSMSMLYLFPQGESFSNVSRYSHRHTDDIPSGELSYVHSSFKGPFYKNLNILMMSSTLNNRYTITENIPISVHFPGNLIILTTYIRCLKEKTTYAMINCRKEYFAHLLLHLILMLSSVS